ncbi:MAG TPA: phospholipase [Conexibacter sp.]|jgi:phospholipase/carboxylesterase|nr:phospholipase [Conexibacter sp.]
MTTAAIDLLPHAVRAPAGAAAGALVLLHGRGTSERDLLPVADALDPQRRLAVIAPRGPLAFPGQPGAHWYVVPRVGFPDEETFAATYARLAAWLDALAEALGVPWSRTVLGGFSQGAAMAFALGLGPGRPAPAGILALSGFLPHVAGYEPVLSGRKGFPVALGHGAADPVIPVAFAHAARERLLAAGVDLLYRETPGLPHTIDPGFVPELRDWLAQRTPATRDVAGDG